MVSIDRITEGTESFALTPKERQYLNTGATGGYRESTLQEQVEDKARTLPARIFRLRNDIVLLDDEEGLSDNLGQTIWRDLMENAMLPRETRPTKGVSDIEESVSPSTPAMRTGQMFGEMVSPLARADEDSFWNLVPHVLLGFLEGIFINQMAARKVDEFGYTETVESIIDQTTELAAEVGEKRTSTSEFFSKTRESIERQEKFRAAGQHHVEKILSEEGIPGVEYETLEERFKRKDGQNREDRSPDQLDLASLTDSSDLHFSIPHRTWSHIVADHVDTDHIPGSAGVERHKIDIENTEPEEFASKDRVLDVFKQYRILGRVVLGEHVREDISKLNEQHWRGVEAEDVLESIYREEPISSRAIAKETGENKSLVTHLANLLSGKDFEVHESWNPLPVVEGDSSQWSLSDYGSVLTEYHFGNHNWTIDSLPDSTVYDGIDALIDSGVVDPLIGIKSP